MRRRSTCRCSRPLPRARQACRPGLLPSIDRRPGQAGVGHVGGVLAELAGDASGTQVTLRMLGSRVTVMSARRINDAAPTRVAVKPIAWLRGPTARNPRDWKTNETT